MILASIFVIYEFLLNRYYKEDLKNEKLIAFFSDARMQLMKMLYMKETTKESYYFTFMMRATSYSIRTIYYRKDKVSKEQLDCLKEIANILDSEKLKDEFKDLNAEQKEIFCKTAIKILEIYFNANFICKLLFKTLCLKVGLSVLNLFSKLLDSKTKETMNYINDIESSYSLSKYALAA